MEGKKVNGIQQWTTPGFLRGEAGIKVNVIFFIPDVQNNSVERTEEVEV